MSEWKQKRFWTDASHDERPDGFAILLDDREIKTPAKATLIVPTQALAQAIAAEWDAQKDIINPAHMPNTRSANAAIDKVQTQQTEVANMIAAYGETDLLCYRADGPDALIVRQNDAWNPLLNWAVDRFDARLQPHTGVMFAPQNEKALRQLSKEVHRCDAFQLTALHDLVSLTGSLIIGLAATQNDHSAAMLWASSRIDEDWQSEQWGLDDEAVKETEIKREAFLHAYEFYRLAEITA
ncbi:ATP12 family protein [Parasulfitobacter algicola]|uniref:ATPase n=1 Tax=Parasulfitobacter algicola TaxID=2614809 RepID=A0ABX2J009_9RHOB|nr:ATPase [Sulfitobacter algicola]